MNASFERQKNIKAIALTLGMHAMLFLMFFYIAFQIPVPPAPMPQEGFEVNLGNSETGLGDEAPLAAESPAPSATESENAASASTAGDAAMETNDDVSEVATVKKSNTVSNKPKSNSVPVKPKQNTKQETVALQQKPNPQPKALYKGGSGAGGNDADSYNNSRNQGIAGGSGDQGKPTGNINSNSYTGNSASGNGVSISKQGFAGRSISRTPAFDDDFNENATIALDVTINADGNVVTANFRQLGSTSSNPTLRRIALQRVKQVQFDKGNGEGKGVLLFRFRLKE